MHYQLGGNLSLVILTFDLHIQTRPSEGSHVFRVNLTQIRSAVPQTFHTRTKKGPNSHQKTEPYVAHCVH